MVDDLTKRFFQSRGHLHLIGAAFNFNEQIGYKDG